MGLFESFLNSLGYFKLSNLSPAQSTAVAVKAKEEENFLSDQLDDQLKDLSEKPKKVLSEEHKAKIRATAKANAAKATKKATNKVNVPKAVKKTAKKV